MASNSKRTKPSPTTTTTKPKKPTLPQDYHIPKIKPTTEPPLTGVALFTDLLSRKKIKNSSSVLDCKTAKLTPKDLSQVFPFIGLSTLSAPASLLLTLSALETMNRTAETKSVASGSKMNMETLLSNRDIVTQPRLFPEIYDDLTQKSTSLRQFHRLPLESMETLFVMDATHHVDHTPVMYDLSDIGGSAQVTEKGWADIQNPGNPGISIKHFMPKNLYPNQGKKIKLDDSIVIMDTSVSRDADTVKELKRAWSLFLRLMHQTHPAILFYHTLDAFLVDKDWFYRDDCRKNVAQALFCSNFIDYILLIVGRAYLGKDKPPTKDSLDSHLRSFLDSLVGTPNRDRRSAQGDPPRGRPGQSTSGNSRTPGATHTPLCKYFNMQQGCNDADATTNKCQTNNKFYEHRCNFYNAAAGKRCRQLHSAITHSVKEDKN